MYFRCWKNTQNSKMPDNDNPQMKIIGTHPNKSDGNKPSPSGKNFLLLIGVSIYSDSNIRKLPNAVKDVDDFEKILTSKYRFDKENAIKLYNEHATSKGIINSLRDLIKYKLKPEDSLIIYFSGHGEFDRDFNKGFWVPFEAVLDDKSTYISNIDLKDYLDAFAEKCRHIFLISDSCFSGALFGHPLKELGNNVIETEPSRYGLTSGRDEPVSDGERGKNSPFSKHLLNTLKKNETALGVVSLSDTVMRLVAYDIDTEQTPRADPLNIRGHQGGQFIFHLRENENEDWLIAQNENTIEAYQKFLKQYSMGNNSDRARKNLFALEDERDWLIACRKNTETSFDNYYEKYPTGKHRVDALSKMSQLAEQKSFDVATKINTISEYRKFLEKYLTGSLAEEARKRINTIKENDNEESTSLRRQDEEREKTGKLKQEYETAEKLRLKEFKERAEKEKQDLHIQNDKQYTENEKKLKY